MGRISIVVIAVLILVSATGRAAVEPVVQCNPEPTDMFIAYGDIVTCSIEASGDADTFRFSGSMGESIQIELRGTESFGLHLSVSDPDGIVIGGGNTNNGAYLPIQGLKLEKTGTYTIIIEGGVTGEDYTFFVERGTPPPSSALAVQYGETITDELNPIGDVDALSFQANEGDVITVSTAGVADTDIDLYAPDGTLTVGVFIGKLNQTGTYTLLIGSLGFNQSGEYTITISCTAGPCVPALPSSPVGGSVTGVSPTKVVCGNVTTKQRVVIKDEAPVWDCEAAGLSVTPGATIRQTVTGTANTPPPGVGGSVSGVSPTKVLCGNVTTKQRVVIKDEAPVWDCEAAGLSVTPGDTIRQIVTGTAD